MYIPSIHKPENQEDVYEYIKKNGFATLVSRWQGRHIATHIPMHLAKNEQGQYTLAGHFAAANEQRNCLDGMQELLAIFVESHAYISSSWYDHINVPTWNYVSVHAYGKARILNGEELQHSIHKMVEQYEAGRPDRFRLADMSDKMRHAHFKGLVGFEMVIDKLETAYKLSQNRKDNDYRNVIEQLENEADQKSHQIAKEMKKIRS